MKSSKSMTGSFWRWAACLGCSLCLLTARAEDHSTVADLRPENSPPSDGRLNQEDTNDQVIWQITRELLDDTGYRSKIPKLDKLWSEAHTSQQWAELRPRDWPDPTKFDAPRTAIIEICRANARAGFGVVFQSLCASNPPLLDLFTGIVEWTQQGGDPRLQRSDHYALHFIYGGMWEASFGMGYAAGIAKEKIDQSNGGDFNQDEMAAAIAGAEWVHQARLHPEWVSEWASGRKNFARNLPPLHYGIGEYSATTVEKIRADIVAAYAR